MIDDALIGDVSNHFVKEGGGAVSQCPSYGIEDEALRVLNLSVLKEMNEKCLITRIADIPCKGGPQPRAAETLSDPGAVKGHEMTEASGGCGRVVLCFED